MTVYKAQRRFDGSYVARSTSYDEVAAESIGVAAGRAIGGGIDLAGAAIRSARERRMILAGQALHAASEDTDVDRFLTLASDFTRRYPREEFGHANLAQALCEKERFREALSELERALELGLDEWEGLRLRAQILDDSGAVGAAVQAYSQLTDNSAYRAVGLLGRAGCLAQLDDLDLAIRDAEEAVSIMPDGMSYFVRGSLHWRRGDADRCVADLTRVLQMQPDDIDVLECRAEAYEFLAQTDLAGRDRDSARAQAERTKPAGSTQPSTGDTVEDEPAAARSGLRTVAIVIAVCGLVVGIVGGVGSVGPLVGLGFLVLVLGMVMLGATPVTSPTEDDVVASRP